jgi:hypothetical protein
LHSIIGASVFARSSATMLAVIAAIICSLSSVCHTPPALRCRRQEFVSALREFFTDNALGATISALLHCRDLKKGGL